MNVKTQADLFQLKPWGTVGRNSECSPNNTKFKHHLTFKKSENTNHLSMMQLPLIKGISFFFVNTPVRHLIDSQHLTFQVPVSRTFPRGDEWLVLRSTICVLLGQC